MTNEQQPLDELVAYAREASIALMKLSGGGSEMFKRIGDEFYAEPDLCVRRAEEKLRTVRKLARPSTVWEDIATAPKDGTRILLGRPAVDLGGGMEKPAFTAEAWFQDGAWVAGSALHEYFIDQDDPPTHWANLPQPPEQSR